MLSPAPAMMPMRRRVNIVELLVCRCRERSFDKLSTSCGPPSSDPGSAYSDPREPSSAPPPGYGTTRREDARSRRRRPGGSCGRLEVTEDVDGQDRHPAIRA